MKTPKSTTQEGDIVQAGIRIPRTMYERLQGERGFSEEVRRRLLDSLAMDELDPGTREFVADVTYLAEEVSRQSGRFWCSHVQTREALKVALAAWVDLFRIPRGPVSKGLGLPELKPDTDKLDFDPATLGMAIARSYEAISDARRKFEAELEEQQAKTKRGRDRKIGRLAHYVGRKK